MLDVSQGAIEALKPYLTDPKAKAIRVLVEGFG